MRTRRNTQRPKRPLGSRIPFVRKDATEQYKQDYRSYKRDRDSDRVLDEMSRRAAVRGQNFEELNDGAKRLLEAEVLGRQAFGNGLKAAGAVAAAGGGLYALGASNGQVGTDPLAIARNNVANASAMVNSDNVLSALVQDDMDMRAYQAELEQTALQQMQQPTFEGQVSLMVDQRAKELQGVPIQKSDGTVVPMPYDQAIRYAQEEIALQLRAEGIV